MKVLIINHELLVRDNIKPIEYIVSKYANTSVKIVVPPSFLQVGRVISSDSLQNSKLDVVTIPSIFWKRPQIQLYNVLMLKKVLDEWQPDIVHIFQEPFNFASLELLWLLKTLKKIPKIIVRCSVVEGIKLSSKIEPIFRWVERKVLPRVDGVECINLDSLSYIRSHAPQAASAVIPWSRDGKIFFPGNNEDLRREMGLISFTIGYFGSFTSQKDIPTLLKAADILKKDGKQFQILLVGDGVERKNLQSISAALGLTENIVWHHPVTSEQIPEFYRCLDAFVLPSRTEPHNVEVFGRVLIEAMACNVPVIGSSSGAIPEVIGNAGLIFQEGDPSSLACRIGQVMAGDQPGELSGRDRFLKFFTHEAKGRQLWGFYNQVLESSRS